MTYHLHTGRLLRDMTWRSRIRVIVFAFPVLCLLAALGFGVEAALFVARSEPVKGTVVQRHDRVGETIFDRGVPSYEPVFTYMDGATPRRASVGSAHSSFDVAIGQTATIRQFPGATGNVRMDTWQGLWFMPVVLGLIGAASLVVAALVWGLLRMMVFSRGKAT
ncbi:MAG: putative membrane protein (DUF2207) [Rhodobacteraceae bacterium HLUCCA08]|nr:MAG: putative membrane protein (DUF2207) [Rhodobacteraceae bacterium HLUCCA08]